MRNNLKNLPSNNSNLTIKMINKGNKHNELNNNNKWEYKLIKHRSKIILCKENKEDSNISC